MNRAPPRPYARGLEQRVRAAVYSSSSRDRVVQLLEQSEVMGRVLGGFPGIGAGDDGKRRPHLLRRPAFATAVDPDLVRVDARALQPLAVPLDAEAALRKAEASSPQSGRFWTKRR